MAKEDKSMLSEQASEQPPRSKSSTSDPSTMPQKGSKMAHEVMNDKMAKKLGC